MGYNFKNLQNWSQKWISNLDKNIVIEFDLFYHSQNIVYKFSPFLPQFWRYDVTRIVKFPNFWKMTEDQSFDPKKYTWFHVYKLSFAVWSWCIALKLLVGKLCQEGAPVSHLPANILQKIKSLVSIYNLSHFAPIFKKIEEKLVLI